MSNRAWQRSPASTRNWPMFDIIPDMAAKRAELAGDASAFHDVCAGEDWSFGRVDATANGAATALRQQGLSEGYRVAALCLNSVRFFVLLLACQKAGLMLCPLNWREPTIELVRVMSPIAPKLIVHDDAFAGPAMAVADALGIPSASIEARAVIWQPGQPGSVGMIPADRPWYLLFTSGTTGRPKAVIQTARMVWANAVNIGQAMQLTASDRSVNFQPIFHTAGINLYTLPVFLTGGSSTILPRFDAPDPQRE